MESLNRQHSLSNYYLDTNIYPYSFLDIKRVIKNNIIDRRFQRIIGTSNVTKIRNKLCYIILNLKLDIIPFILGLYSELLKDDGIENNIALQYIDKMKNRLESNINDAASKQKLSIVKSYNVKLSSLVNRVINQNDSLDASKIEITSLGKQIDLLKTENQLLSQENVKLSENNVLLVSQIQKLQSSNSGILIIDSVEQLPLAIHQYEEKIATHHQSLERFIQQVSSLQDDILKSNEVIDKEKKVVQKLKDDQKFFNDRISKNQLEIENLRKENSQKQQLNKKQLSEINKLKQDINSKISEIDGLKSKFQDLEQKMKAETSSLERQHFAALHHKKVTSTIAPLNRQQPSFFYTIDNQKGDLNKYIKIDTIEDCNHHGIASLPLEGIELINAVKHLGRKYNDEISELEVLYLLVHNQLKYRFFQKSEHKNTRKKWGLTMLNSNEYIKVAVNLDKFCSNS